MFNKRFNDVAKIDKRIQALQQEFAIGGVAVNAETFFQQAFAAGRNAYIDYYNSEIAPLLTRQKVALVNWMTTLHRIHEVVQIGVGANMTKRLEQLGPKLAQAGAEYKNSLIALTKLTGRSTDAVQNGIVAVSSAYEEHIANILSGKPDAVDQLRKLHQGFEDSDWRADLFSPFESAVSTGRPKGMSAGRRLLAERVLQREESTAYNKLAAIRSELATWDGRQFLPHDDLTDDDFSVLECLKKVKMERAAKYVSDLIADYERSVKTF